MVDITAGKGTVDSVSALIDLAGGTTDALAPGDCWSWWPRVVHGC